MISDKLNNQIKNNLQIAEAACMYGRIDKDLSKYTIRNPSLHIKILKKKKKILKKRSI